MKETFSMKYKKPAKKRLTKEDKRNIIKKKYEELYWRLHNHPNKNVDNDVWQDDFKWIRNQITDMDCDSVIRKMDLYAANQMWKKYE